MRRSAYAAKQAAAPAQPVELTTEKVAAAMRTFFRIMSAWEIDNESARVLLGQPSRATFFHWKKGEVRTVSHDTVQRVSYLLGIFKALETLFPTPARSDAWIKKKNQLFGGQSALERMLAGDVTDLAAVRSALDAVRGGGA